MNMRIKRPMKGMLILVWMQGMSYAQEVWTFDRIDKIGGHPTTVLGHPHVIDTPLGKAVEFNGVDDGLQIDLHPLAGAETFAWEAIFRPDGGNAEQRWFHLEENPATGSDSDNRMLFEIRVIDGRWCLDAFNKSGPEGLAQSRQSARARRLVSRGRGLRWRRVPKLHRWRTGRRCPGSSGAARPGPYVGGSSDEQGVLF